MVLSTNCKRFTLILFQPTMKSFDKQLSSTLSIILLTTPTTMVKRNGEIASPCLKPLVALTHSLAFSFISVTKLIEDKLPLIQQTPIHMIISLLKIYFEDYSFLTSTPFLIQHFIGNHNIQNLSPFNKGSPWDVDGFMENSSNVS